jgi:uncharacterized RDD family membrane protein YckC
VKGGARSPKAPQTPAPRAQARAAVTPPPGAGLLRRLGAMVYDGMLIIALWMATLFPMVALANHAVTGATVQTLLFLELYAFYVFFWLYRGQTLGMLAWKLEIRTEDGTPLSLARATLRFFTGTLPLVFAAFAWRLFGTPAAVVCLAVGGLGYLWVLIDRENRAWIDLMSGTRMVRSAATPRPQ